MFGLEIIDNYKVYHNLMKKWNETFPDREMNFFIDFKRNENRFGLL